MPTSRAVDNKVKIPQKIFEKADDPTKNKNTEEYIALRNEINTRLTLKQQIADTLGQPMPEEEATLAGETVEQLAAFHAKQAEKATQTVEQ